MFRLVQGISPASRYPFNNITENIPVGNTVEFWSYIIKSSAPMQMMKNVFGEELWREKEKVALAWPEEILPTRKGPLTSDAWLGVGGKISKDFKFQK